MRDISERRIHEFDDKYSDAAAALANWKRAIRAGGWKNHAEVKAQFHDSDLVGEKTVLNIAKNLSRKFSRTGTTARGHGNNEQA